MTQELFAIHAILIRTHIQVGDRGLVFVVIVTGVIREIEEEKDFGYQRDNCFRNYFQLLQQTSE